MLIWLLLCSQHASSGSSGDNQVFVQQNPVFVNNTSHQASGQTVLTSTDNQTSHSSTLLSVAHHDQLVHQEQLATQIQMPVVQGQEQVASLQSPLNLVQRSPQATVIPSTNQCQAGKNPTTNECPASINPSTNQCRARSSSVTNQCPSKRSAAQNQCPGSQSSCGAAQNQCAASQSQCPAAQKQCQAAQNRCSASRSPCLAESQGCPLTNVHRPCCPCCQVKVECSGSISADAAATAQPNVDISSKTPGVDQSTSHPSSTSSAMPLSTLELPQVAAGMQHLSRTTSAQASALLEDGTLTTAIQNGIPVNLVSGANPESIVLNQVFVPVYSNTDKGPVIELIPIKAPQ